MKYFILAPILFITFIYFFLVKDNILLTDDLGMIYQPVFGNNEYNYLKFISNFIDQDIMTSRPVSAFFYGTIIFLTQFFSIKFYFVNYLFFITAITSVYLVVKKLLNESIAIVSSLFYTLIPIGSSIVFSPIMMNSNLATIFFCGAIYFSTKKKLGYLILSASLFITSILSYEIFIPLIFLFYFTLKIKNSKKIIFITFTLFSIFIYREFIEVNIFDNHFHRDQKLNFLDFGRNVDVITTAIKMHYNILLSLAKSIRALQFFSIIDYILLLLFMVVLVKSINRVNLDLRISNQKLLVILLCSISTFSIFILSSYLPNAYGFDNRNLGAMRLFYAILFTILILKIPSQKIKKYLLTSIFLLLAISTISIKNAWIFADKTNKQLFYSLSEIIKHEKLKSDTILISYDLNSRNKIFSDQHSIFKNHHFILKEPIFSEEWEVPYLKKVANIKENVTIRYLYKVDKNKINDSYYIYNWSKNILIKKEK